MLKQHQGMVQDRESHVEVLIVEEGQLMDGPTEVIDSEDRLCS